MSDRRKNKLNKTKIESNEEIDDRPNKMFKVDEQDIEFLNEDEYVTKPSTSEQEAPQMEKVRKIPFKHRISVNNFEPIIQASAKAPINLNEMGNRFDTCRVTFVAFIPKSCFNLNLNRLKITFFIEDHIYERPLNVHHEIDLIERVFKSGETLYEFQIRAEIPYVKNQVKQSEIFYFYTKEVKSEDGRLVNEHERSLVADKQLRALNLRAYFEDNISIFTKRANIDLKNSGLELIDGLIFTGNQNQSGINSMNIVEALLPFELLTIHNQAVFEQFSKVLTRFSDIFEHLCQEDNEYKDCFFNLIRNGFVKIVDLLSTFYESQHFLEEWHFPILLICFYATIKYQLNVRDIQSFFVKLLRPFCKVPLMFLNKLRSLFLTLNLEKDFKLKTCEFLKANQENLHLMEGVNAMTILFSLESSNYNKSEFESSNSKTNHLKNILAYRIGVQGIKPELIELFIQNTDYIHEEHSILAAYFMNYFSIDLVDNMEAFLKSDKIPAQAFIIYLKMRIESLENYKHQFKTRFLNPVYGGIFRNVVSHLSSNLFKEKVKSSPERFDQLSNLFVLSVELVQSLIRHFSKELDSIFALFEFSFNLFLYIRTLYSDRSDEIRFGPGDLIKKLIEIECNESMIVNFGIYKRTKEEYEEYERKIEEQDNEEKEKMVNNKKAIKTDKAQRATGMDYMKLESELNRRTLTRNQMMSESNKKLVYMGTSDEAGIYNRLLSLRLINKTDAFIANYENHVHDLFRRRVDNQIKSHFESAIVFRTQFKYEKLVSAKLFEELTDSRIVNALIETDKYLIKVCECLKLSDNKLNQTLLSKYVHHLLVFKWPKEKKEEYKFMLTWANFMELFRINLQAKATSLNRPIPDESEWYGKYLDLLKRFAISVNSLINGTETIENLKLFAAHFDIFFKHVDFLNGRNLFKFEQLEPNKPVSSDLLRRLVSTRTKEFEMFCSFMLNLKKLVDFALLFDQLDVELYEQKLKHLRTLGDLESSLTIKDICVYLPFEHMNTTDLSKYMPNVTYFDRIDLTNMEIVKKIIAIDRNNAVLFDWFFAETCHQAVNELKVNKLDIEQFLHKVWPVSFQKWKSVAQRVESGEIKLSELETLSQQIFKNDMAKIQQELIYLNKFIGIKNCDKRNKQIVMFFKYLSSYDAARSIEETRVKLALTDKFNELRDILNLRTHEFTTWTLEKMDEKMEKILNILEKVNDVEKIRCLVSFAESLELIDWLRRNTKNLNELKFLVDISTTVSSSQLNDNIDSTIFAKTLKEAGTAYASLIYELKQSDDFVQFIELSEKVCSHLESDKRIADKLLAIKDKSNLLNEIKNIKGGVELNSIKKVKQINDEGVFTIQNTYQLNELFEFKQKLSVQDLIKLQTTTQSYTFNDLKELQNILMLLAPRQADEDESETLDYFTQLFSYVVRLSEYYIKLVEHGCLFYETFSVLVYADFSNKRFKSNQPCLQLNNVDYRGEQSIECIDNLCLLMEETLRIWNKYMWELRERFSALNFYTIKQLKFLCFTMSKVNNLKESSLEFEFMSNMLHNVCEYVTIDKLKATLESCKKIVFRMEFNSQLNAQQFKQIPANQMFYASFDRLWREFFQKEKEDNSSAMSLKHLGIFLNLLRDEEAKCKRLPEVHRNIPGYLNKKGTPSLIVCPHRDQIKVALSLYEYHSIEPLPSNEEVLYCDLHTSAEQIENFLRIAFKSNGSRIYTLLNVQDISYENSNRVKDFFFTYPHKSNSYVLVIISDDERKAQSTLVQLLSKMQIKPIIMPTSDLEEYVSQKLIKLNVDFNSFNLALFDSDRSTCRALLSQRSGNGKSEYVKQLVDNIRAKHANKTFNYETIRIKSFSINVNEQVEKLFKIKQTNAKSKAHKLPTIYHIDFAFEVFLNVDYFLFYLVVCGYLKHSNGLVWRRDASSDYYLFEMTAPYVNADSRQLCLHSMLNFMPKIEFRHPQKYLYDLKNQSEKNNELKDNLFTTTHTNPKFQRVCFYLKLVSDTRARMTTSDNNQMVNYGQTRQEVNLFKENFDAEKNYMNEIDCLEIIFAVTGLVDPNWHELVNFVTFFNSQLERVERSIFLNNINELSDFKGICVQLILFMANDFGLSSLNSVVQRDNLGLSSEEASSVDVAIEKFEIREDRRWENMVHPYIIMNPDCESVTFIGVCLDRPSKTLINPYTNQPLQKTIKYVPVFPGELFIQLLKQGLKFFDNFNSLHREKKIISLCNVMRIEQANQLARDPDESYELTLDNCLKMMAIYLRLTCNIPVVLMGETGCGKTRLIQFFAKLHLNVFKKNLINLKVHGGTTAADIEASIVEAEELSKHNFNQLKGKMDNLNDKTNDKKNELITCILFFDEANASTEVGLIKEIMCDSTINGRKIDTSYGLKFVAAVNPYRKHSKQMIDKLESAGLGFFGASQEKLGSIPMRHLVYRVQPLPTSFMPLVWDFGQLDNNTEMIYIKQILKKSIKTNKFCLDSTGQSEIKWTDTNELNLLSDLLNASQVYMKSREDECSFVSLRNIERVIKVASWFLSKHTLILKRMSDEKLPSLAPTRADQDILNTLLTNVRRAFVLSLCVCYHASLFDSEKRQEYRQLIMKIIDPNQSVPYDWVLDELGKCQNVFMNEISLSNNIARNSALLENVFMMIICIELRIPLFIVGKPGSSKSLAKSIVSKSMEGRNSKSAFFRNLKESYFVNFQCSPLTTPEMIVQAFSEASKFQENADLKSSVAVVNLDEIGLAEGSESMPLKALHPLLEDSNIESAELREHEKVAVIGISNWALDPAKINRGILVSRGEPDINELIDSAKGICKFDKAVYGCIEPYIKELATAYLDLCQMARDFKREFFGLRDYYSLIKMIACLCATNRVFNWSKLEYSVKRNFSGLEIDNLKPFAKLLYDKMSKERSMSDPKCEPIDILESALKCEYGESSSRYLLFLTENNAAIDIIENYLLNIVKKPPTSLQIIFGSSFRLDQQYDEICRNISLIKHSMEIGKTVILLNSHNLYESLYDALNQYYSEFGGQKFVDLGLGTHRVKCSVHDNFRLIVIAEKEIVYDSKRFPIPLINRLEKHFLNSYYMLNQQQLTLVNRLNKEFVNLFAKHTKQRDLNKIFVGFHSDTIATLVLYLTGCAPNVLHRENQEEERMEHNQECTDESSKYVIEQAKKYLLRCATPDSILKMMTPFDLNSDTKDFLWNEYFMDRKHLSLSDLLAYHFSSSTFVNENQVERDEEMMMSLDSKVDPNETANFSIASHLLQITTHSKASVFELKSTLSVNLNVDSCILESFDNQIQFHKKIKSFFRDTKCDESNKKCILLIQTEFDRDNRGLIACARHIIVDCLKDAALNAKASTSLHNLYIALVINLPKEHVEHFIGFQLAFWSCYHLDELEFADSYLPALESLRNKSLSTLVEESLQTNQSSLQILLPKLVHKSCALIVDTNLNRTIQRIELLKNLCADVAFTSTLTKLLVKLQKEKEVNFIQQQQQVQNWLIKEVANVKSNSKLSSLRRTCENYIEEKLCPLLAYILSFIDLYSNLNTYAPDDAHMSPDKATWKLTYWLKIIQNEEICPLSYGEMRDKNSSFSKELTQFKCQSDWLKKSHEELYDENKSFSLSLPFSWLLVDLLGKLYANYTETNRQTEMSLDTLVKSLSRIFQETQFYSLIEQLSVECNADAQFKRVFLDCYLNDFILMNFSLNSRKDLHIIKQLFVAQLAQLPNIYKDELKYMLPLLNHLLMNVEERVKLYLKFSAFEPELTAADTFSSSKYFNTQQCLQIHYDACISCVNLFRANLFKKQTTKYQLLTRIGVLFQLIAQIDFINASKNEEKLNLIKQQYDSLMVLKLFLNKMEFNEPNFDLNDLFVKCIHKLNNEFFQEHIDFKDAQSLAELNAFVIVCYESFTQSIKIEKHVSEIKSNLSKFYIEAIECLCFKNGQYPNDEAIKTILKVITGRLEDASNSLKFELDKSYRTLLVQVVFRYYNDTMEKHLRDWFNSNSLMGKQDLFSTVEEVALLFQNCVFDQCYQDSINEPLDSQLRMANQIAKEILANFATFQRIFSDQEKKKLMKTYETRFLILLARFKFAVCVLAKLTHNADAFNSIADLSEFNEFNENMHSLINKLNTTDTLNNYLLKDMIRKYGSASVKFVNNNEKLKWMIPKDMASDESYVMDKYVLSGENYLKCKKAILASFKEKSAEKLSEILENNSAELLPYIGMAFYQNITLLYRNIGNLSKEIGDIFEPIVSKHYKGLEVEKLKSLLHNSMSNRLKIDKANWSEIDLNLLLVQVKFCVLSSKSSLIAPLKELIESPESIQNSFIPTMEQDNLYDVKIALTNSAHTSTTKLYSCPNGHIYAIGECGRPWVASKCNECNEDIGGTNHELLGKNIRVDETIQDKTLRGYILQEAAKEKNLLNDLRLLSDSSFHIERFFVNACMYLACGDNFENVEAVKSGMLNQNYDLKEFFWKHMQKDMSLACKALNVNMDEMFLILHLICNKFLKIHQTLSKQSFTTKENRQSWEGNFDRIFILSLLKDKSETILEANKSIQEKNTKENQDDQSKLYFMAYELLSENKEKANHLYENETFWKYRPIVTYEQMHADLLTGTRPESFKILKKFLNMFNQVQLLNYLPDLLCLVKVLKSMFDKSIFKQNARSCSIKEFLSTSQLPKNWSMKQVEHSVKSFQIVWKMIKKDINNHIRTNISKFSYLSNIFEHEFNMNTKLSFFLPRTDDDGLCSYSLIHYLCSIQNELLKFFNETKNTNNSTQNNIDLFQTNEYLIICNQIDMNNLVQTNFFYDSKQMKCVFNFENIENLLIDRYFITKAEIDVKTIPMFEYSDEISDLKVFRSLNSSIKQEMIDVRLQQEIMTEFTEIEQLSEALHMFKTILNYSICISPHADEDLSVFIKKIYLDYSFKNTESIFKTKVTNCKLKHLQNIWLLWSMKKSILSTLTEQNPFETLSDRFRANTVSSSWKSALNYDKPLWLSFILVVYQLITFVLSSMNSEDAEHYSQIPLLDILATIDSLDNLNLLIPKNMNNILDYVTNNFEQPDQIKLDRIFSIWKDLCSPAN